MGKHSDSDSDSEDEAGEEENDDMFKLEVLVEDMVNLTHLTEEALLWNLRGRFAKGEIYTYTGSILISLNPYKTLPLYTPNKIKEYTSIQIGSLPPHVFAVADDSYRHLMTDQINQSILISGESGSGKTEATKLVMQYLAAITSTHSKVEQQILEANPVLEAFGNAKTVRNDNSSRFGKYIMIHFHPNGHISGASIEQYLLEKSRIVFQNPGERNFHAFYQLLAGATPEIKERLHLEDVDHYHYINQGDAAVVDTMDDAEEFNIVLKSLDVLGFSEAQQNDIFSVLAAVLHMGNLQFEPSQHNEDMVQISTPEELAYAAGLLQVKKDDLATALCERHIQAAGESCVVYLKKEEAIDTRDALAKAIYSNMFAWLVDVINDSIGANRKHQFIGVLDIFGFENFNTNLFEQLCINYANEKLHQYFNKYIFKLEQDEYDKEGINWTKIDFKDNSLCLDLIESKTGLLSSIDEECRVPRGSDGGFLQKMHDAYANHVHYLKPRRPGTTFGVEHYAGPVHYDTTGFLEKNKDTLFQDLQIVMRASSSPLVNSLFKGSTGSVSKLKQLTVGAKFKNQLVSLMQTISETKPHYVRCIKPNAEKAALTFVDDLVQIQLRYSGMLDTIRIRRSGYPVRYSFEKFWVRYRLLAPSIQKSKSTKKACKALLKALTQPPDTRADGDDEEQKKSLALDQEMCQLGKTKVFMRDHVLLHLEERRVVVLGRSALKIQTIFRGWSKRSKYQVLRQATIKGQATYRMWRQRKQYYLWMDAAILIESVVRMLRPSKAFRAKRRVAAVLQTYCRMRIARHAYLAQRKNTMRIQTWFRCQYHRRLYARVRCLALWVQSTQRMAMAHALFLKKKRAATLFLKQYRRWIWAKHYEERCEWGSTIVQKTVRGFVARSRFVRTKRAAIRLQAWYRCVSAHRHYLRQRQAAIRCQAFGRGAIARQQFVSQRKAALVCQSHARGWIVQQRFARGRQVAIAVQTLVRMHRHRRIFVRKQTAAICLQCWWRKHQCMQWYHMLQDATVKVQAFVRAYRQSPGDDYPISPSRLILRAGFRAKMEHTELAVIERAVTIIGSAVRMLRAKRAYVRDRQHVVLAQACFRSILARRQFLHQRTAVVVVQALFRGAFARKRANFERGGRAVSKIQSLWRTRQAQRKYRHTIHCVSKIQAAFKAKQARKDYLVQIWKQRRALGGDDTVSGAIMVSAGELHAGLGEYKPQVEEELEDYSSSSMLIFAKANFQPHFTGLRSKRRPMKPEELVVFSRDPLTCSLLRMSVDDPKARARLDKKAVELFEVIRLFMGDSFGKRRPERWVNQVAHAAMTTPQLASEIFCQICRQLTGNPNASSVDLGWQLLSLLCGIFPPNDDFLPTLRGFLQLHEKQSTKDEAIQTRAKYAHARLRRILESGPRLHPPEPAEVTAVLAREAVNCTVHIWGQRAFPESDAENGSNNSDSDGDGNWTPPNPRPRDILVRSTTTVGEVVSRLKRVIGLNLATEMPGLCLHLETARHGSESVSDSTYLLDIDSEIGQLHFSKRLHFRAELRDMSHLKSQAVAFLYDMLLRQLITAELLMSKDNLATALHFALAAEGMVASTDRGSDATQPTPVKWMDFKPHMDENISKLQSDAEWRKAITAAKTATKTMNKGQTPVSLESLPPGYQGSLLHHRVQFIQTICNSSPWFGSMVFDATIESVESVESLLPEGSNVKKVQKKLASGNSVVLAVNESGLSIFLPESRLFDASALKSLVTTTYSRLTMWELEPEGASPVQEALCNQPNLREATGLRFVARAEQADMMPAVLVVRCQAQDAREANTLLSDYRQLLLEHAHRAVAIQDHVVSDPSLLSFRRGDTIEVLEKDEDSSWYHGQFDMNVGLFPKSAVELIIDPIDVGADDSGESQSRLQSKHLRDNLDEQEPSNRNSGAWLLNRGGAGARGSGAWTAMNMLNLRRKKSQTERGGTVVETTRRGRAMTLLTPSITEELTMLNLAKLYFKEPETSGFMSFFGGASDDDWLTMLRHKPQERKTALLKLPDSLNASAVEISKAILRFIGNEPGANAKAAKISMLSRQVTTQMVGPQHVVAEIVQMGIETELLASEVIFQICTHITGNENLESYRKAWLLLIICLGCFIPDAKYLRYFRAGFLEKEPLQGHPCARSYAEQCSIQLKRTAHNGPRKWPPSRVEIDALREQRPVVVRVRLMTGTWRLIMCDSATTSRETIQALCKTLGLKADVHAGGFALYACMNSADADQSLESSDHVLDYVSEWEHQQGQSDAGGIGGPMIASSRKRKEQPFQFVFKRRIFVSKYDDITNVAALDLLYHQLRNDIVFGLFPCNRREVVEFAGLQLKVKSLTDDTIVPLEYLQSTLRQFVPTLMLSEQEDEIWISDITKVFETIAAKKLFTAQILYVNKAREWKLYGGAVFPAEQDDDEELPHQLCLIVHKRGIAVCPVNARTSVRSYGFENILHWVHFDDTFCMITGNMLESQKITFTVHGGVAKAKEASALAESYSQLWKASGVAVSATVEEL